MFDDFKKQVVQLFGLNAFRAGQHSSLIMSHDKGTVSFDVEFLWAAEVIYFERPVAVAIIDLKTERKGILIDIEGKVKNHSKVVSLGEWLDPVGLALKCINVAPSGYMLGSIYSLSLFTATEVMETEITMEIDDRDPSLGRLSKAVLEVIEKIALLYEGNDWRRLLHSRIDHE